MSTRSVTSTSRSAESANISKLLKQYGCGPIQFAGTDNALYERHLLFDNVVDSRLPARASGSRPSPARCGISCRSAGCTRRRPTSARIPSASTTSRWSFSSAARWPTTSPTCCSIRSSSRPSKEKDLDWLELLEQEPDAGLGNGGLGRLAACFLDSMATLQLPAMGYGLRYEYGIFRQTIQDGWQHEQPDNWLRRPDPWEVARPDEKVEVKLNCSFELRGGSAARGPRPAVQPDRHPVRPAGRRLRRQDRSTRCGSGPRPRRTTSTSSEFSSGDFVGALAETLAAESLTRVLYPDDSTSMGQGLRFVQEYFLVACSLADLVRRFRAQQRRLERAARQGRHPAQRHASDAGRARADAHPARRRAARLGPGLGPHAARRWPTPTTRCCPRRWRNGRSPGSRCCCRATSRSSTRSTAACSTTSAPASPATTAASRA